VAEAPLALDRLRAVHLVGVGGAGISAIGLVLARMGHRVSGADVTATGVWSQLEAAGIALEVTSGDRLFASAPEGTEIIAHSTAFPPSATERHAAVASGAVVVDRAAILAGICATRRTIAVSGTHGKTSTTAMVATVLDGAGTDPSFLVGATPVGLGVAARWSDRSDWFAVEADESDGTFLHLGAEVAVVTNVDEDHLDFWGDLAAIEAGFERFLTEAPSSVICLDDPHGAVVTDPRALRLAEAHGSFTVGEGPEARLRIRDVAVSHLDTTFGLTLDGDDLGPFSIGTPGRHHARNAAVAVAVALAQGIEPDAARVALAGFVGVTRRFEVVGEAAGVTVVDDYAHNPGKVRALLASAQEAGWDRVVVVFQPHRVTRTRDQGADFGAALALADVVAVTDIYAAGEPPISGVTGRSVLDAVLDVRPHAAAAWTPTLDDAEAWARHTLRPGDLVLTVGAGDISSLGPRLVADLLRRASS
jgi:UDP-N-acetylmuramate--alanine ligase